MERENTPPPVPSRPLILLRLLLFVLVLGAILFFTAGRWDWVTGWGYMIAYTAVTVVSVFAVPMDAGMIEERTRIKPGIPKWDKRLAAAGSALYPLAILVVAALDQRYGWSPAIPYLYQLLALAVVVAGSLLSTWAAAVNPFYARFVRIQSDRGHVVISAGPYGLIRHPGYLGQVIFSLASAIALGSYWTLIPSGLFSLFLVLRTAFEDRFLQQGLAGYGDYAAKVRYRLLPYLW